MAPEINDDGLLEKYSYDHHADIWSLGCTMFYMLFGIPPFPELEDEYLKCVTIICEPVFEVKI